MLATLLPTIVIASLNALLAYSASSETGKLRNFKAQDLATSDLSASYIDYVNPSLIASPTFSPSNATDLIGARDQIISKAIYYSSLKSWGTDGCDCTGSGSGTTGYQTSSDDGNGYSSDAGSQNSAYDPGKTDSDQPQSNTTTIDTSQSSSSGSSNTTDKSQSASTGNSTIVSNKSDAGNSTNNSGTGGNSTMTNSDLNNSTSINNGTSSDGDDSGTYNNNSDSSQNTRTFSPGAGGGGNGSSSPSPSSTSPLQWIFPTGLPDTSTLDPQEVLAGLAGTSSGPETIDTVCPDARSAIMIAAYTAWYNALAFYTSSDPSQAQQFAQASINAISNLLISQESRLQPLCLLAQLPAGGSLNDDAVSLQILMEGLVIVTNAVAMLEASPTSGWTPIMAAAVKTTIAPFLGLLHDVESAKQAMIGGPWYTAGLASLDILSRDNAGAILALDSYFTNPSTLTNSDFAARDALLYLQGQMICAKMGDSLGRSYWDSPVSSAGNIRDTFAHILAHAAMSASVQEAPEILLPMLATLSQVYPGPTLFKMLESTSNGTYVDQAYWLLNQPSLLRSAGVGARPLKRDQVTSAETESPTSTTTTTQGLAAIAQSTTTSTTTSDSAQVYSTSAAPVPPQSPSSTVETATPTTTSSAASTSSTPSSTATNTMRKRLEARSKPREAVHRTVAVSQRGHRGNRKKEDLLIRVPRREDTRRSVNSKMTHNVLARVLRGR